MQAIGSSGIILGQEKTDDPNLKLDFGQYCQVYEETSNNMTPRSVGGIEPRPKNYRGLYYFMSLKTGRRIHDRQWIVIHVTVSVIYRVEKLAADEGINVDGEILFEWDPGKPILLQPYYKEVTPT